MSKIDNLTCLRMLGTFALAVKGFGYDGFIIQKKNRLDSGEEPQEACLPNSPQSGSRRFFIFW